jgi:hypothetical protein
MQKQHYPELQAEADRGRGGVIRDAIIYTPLMLAGLALLVWMLVERLFGDGEPSWVLFVIVALVTALVGFMSQAALRDLLSGPQDVSGPITKKWRRTDSLFVRSHYFAVGGKILHVNTVDWHLHDEGDNVTVRFYPRTGAVSSVERNKPEAQATSA